MKLQILGLFWKILGDFPAEIKVLFTFVSKLRFFSKVFKVGSETKAVLSFLRLRGNPVFITDFVETKRKSENINSQPHFNK